MEIIRKQTMREELAEKAVKQAFVQIAGPIVAAQKDFSFFSSPPPQQQQNSSSQESKARWIQSQAEWQLSVAEALTTIVEELQTNSEQVKEMIRVFKAQNENPGGKHDAEEAEEEAEEEDEEDEGEADP